MERDRHSSQTFIPIQAGCWHVISVQEGADGWPDMDMPGHSSSGLIRAWHHPLSVFDQAARVAVLRWKGGTPSDDEFAGVAPFEIHVPEAEAAHGL